MTLAGKHVIRGKPSKDFNPYMILSGVYSLEDARNKLLVNFDPTRCFVDDLKVSFWLQHAKTSCLGFKRILWPLFFFWFTGVVPKHLQGMVRFSWGWCTWSDMGEKGFEGKWVTQGLLFSSSHSIDIIYSLHWMSKEFCFLFFLSLFFLAETWPRWRGWKHLRPNRCVKESWGGGQGAREERVSSKVA